MPDCRRQPAARNLFYSHTRVNVRERSVAYRAAHLS